MIGQVRSADILGIEAVGVTVEVALEAAKPGISIVGLPDKAVSESGDRVKSAVIQSGFRWPARQARRLVVNLAPAGVAKRGAVFDLPIALGILAASGQIPQDKLEGWFCLGELALDGTLRPVTGVLSAAVLAVEEGARGMVVPLENAEEAAVACSGCTYGFSHLEEVVRFFMEEGRVSPVEVDAESLLEHADETLEDFAEVRGQENAKRAIAVACAGGHNLLMVGPPGAGKSMLARRIPSVLPPLSLEEAIETTRVHSAGGLLPSGQGLVGRRPFRSPHHTVSDAGLIGGGAVASPGEISVAHNGVLFLDEFPEFDRRLREAMRQPMEDGEVTVSRAAYTVTFPARFMLVAAMNPCPCGYYGDSRRRCRCTSTRIEKYLSRISGPLLDRLDIQIEVPAVEYGDLRRAASGTHSEEMRRLVLEARKAQEKRFSAAAGGDGSVHFNAAMGEDDLDRFCRLDDAGEDLLRRAITELGLSARATSRVLKVARTVADMAGLGEIEVQCLAEAIQYRALDRLGLW